MSIKATVTLTAKIDSNTHVVVEVTDPNAEQAAKDAVKALKAAKSSTK